MIFPCLRCYRNRGHKLNYLYVARAINGICEDFTHYLFYIMLSHCSYAIAYSSLFDVIIVIIV